MPRREDREVKVNFCIMPLQLTLRERSMTEEFIEQYVTTPQNDLQQIHQVSREYESEPARGVAHGLQKDAIQNGVGARIPHSSEPTSYKDWAFTFRLFGFAAFAVSALGVWHPEPDAPTA